MAVPDGLGTPRNVGDYLHAGRPAARARTGGQHADVVGALGHPEGAEHKVDTDEFKVPY